MKILKITSTSKSQEPSRSLMSRKVTALSTENDTKTDVFVQKSAVVKNNPKKSIKSLGEGEIVEFDVFAGKNGSEATNVSGPEGVPVIGAPKSANPCWRCYNVCRCRKSKNCTFFAVTKF